MATRCGRCRTNHGNRRAGAAQPGLDARSLVTGGLYPRLRRQLPLVGRDSPFDRRRRILAHRAGRFANAVPSAQRRQYAGAAGQNRLLPSLGRVLARPGRANRRATGLLARATGGNGFACRFCRPARRGRRRRDCDRRVKRNHHPTVTQRMSRRLPHPHRRIVVGGVGAGVVPLERAGRGQHRFGRPRPGRLCRGPGRQPQRRLVHQLVSGVVDAGRRLGRDDQNGQGTIARRPRAWFGFWFVEISGRR